MKLYEWAVYIVNILLVCAGIYLYREDMVVAGIACWVVAAISFLAYLYLAKLRPLTLVRQTFLDAALEYGFAPLDAKQWKKNVRGLLRKSGAFNDVYLGVEDLHGAQNDASVYFLGRYALSGSGLNFGYFMIGLFGVGKTTGIDLEKIQDHGRPFDFEDELALSRLPPEVESMLRKFPYDFHIKDQFFLVDFDARYVQEDNFAESFHNMMNALACLGDS